MTVSTQAFGKRAEKFLIDHLNSIGKDVYAVRFVDTYDANKGRWGNPAQKKVVIARRPSDAILVIEGLTVFIEVKCTESKTGVTPALFSEQVAERTRIENAGGDYAYFIYSRFLHKWYFISSWKLAEHNYKVSWKELDNLVVGECTVPPVPEYN
jgi:hypothetical protein